MAQAPTIATSIRAFITCSAENIELGIQIVDLERTTVDDLARKLRISSVAHTFCVYDALRRLTTSPRPDLGRLKESWVVAMCLSLALVSMVSSGVEEGVNFCFVLTWTQTYSLSSLYYIDGIIAVKAATRTKEPMQRNHHMFVTTFQFQKHDGMGSSSCACFPTDHTSRIGEEQRVRKSKAGPGTSAGSRMGHGELKAVDHEFTIKPAFR
ncbi:hypothetical protein V8F33_007631 [Rhypophila sp. PSN 637]